MSKFRGVSSMGSGDAYQVGRPGAELRPKPTRSANGLRLRSRQFITFLLLWLFVVQYFERWQVSSMIRSCRWKDWEKWPSGADPHHLVVIGDPQLVDNFSYPARNRLLLYLTQRLSDNYLHRNHRLYHQILQPDTALFVGDLFDGGREWTNPVWYGEYSRFHRVFDPIESTRTLAQIPGNHDIGFGNGVQLSVLNRFRTFFGNPNDYLVLGNHTLVLLDTISLSSTDHPEVNKDPTSFLAALGHDDHPAKQYPRVLVSHVPLYRFTESQTCGPLRESKKRFPVMRGKQYQTVIEYELSQRILNSVKPKLVLSGDDHDYCHIRHPLANTGAPRSVAGEAFTDEITVKSSAMTGGIKKPAIQLLSLYNPLDGDADPNLVVEETGSLVVSHDTLRSRLCYLPDPYQSLRWYCFVILLMSASFVMVYIYPDTTARLNSRLRDRLGVIKPLYEDDLVKRQSLKMSLMDFLLDWNVPEGRNWKMCVLHIAASFAVYVCILNRYHNSI
ncbi:hypothetical protein KL951_002075 [Ogataea haglerorum]|nr:hypothetical protein KL951_002075 [Ogataea haglerorum]